MSLKRKAVVFGGGGTLAYYAILLVIGWAADRFQSNGAFAMMGIAAFPLLPSMMPGYIVSLLLAALSIQGLNGPHDNLFAFWPIVSAPLVNSYFVLIWLKRTQIPKPSTSV